MSFLKHSLFLIAAGGAWATGTLKMEPMTILAGETEVQFNLTYTADPNDPIIALQWSIPNTNFTVNLISGGAALVAAGKGITCNATPDYPITTGTDFTTCIAFAPNSNIIESGVVAVIRLSFIATPYGTTTIPFIVDKTMTVSGNLDQIDPILMPGILTVVPRPPTPSFTTRVMGVTFVGVGVR